MENILNFFISLLFLFWMISLISARKQFNYFAGKFIRPDRGTLVEFMRLKFCLKFVIQGLRYWAGAVVLNGKECYIYAFGMIVI